MQLKGSKQWRLLAEPGLSAPMLGFTPHYEATGNLETQTKVHQAFNKTDLGVQYSQERLKRATVITLEEGDIMYHPAGIWHSVLSLTDSVSINFSLRQLRMADLVTNALKMQML
jgi:ribosomal protein L16 Arg81 hydroxylase